MLILLLDDIKIINFLHVKFFRNFTYYFLGILLLVFKKRNFRKLINKDKFHSVKLKKNRKNNYKFLSNKKSFLYNHEQKNTHYFIKNLKEKKCLVFFKEIQKTS